MVYTLQNRFHPSIYKCNRVIDDLYAMADERPTYIETEHTYVIITYAYTETSEVKWMDMKCGYSRFEND